MTRTYQDYKRLLTALLPRGRAWRAEDPIRDQLFDGLGAELARVDVRVAEFLAESDVRTTTELVEEHEYEYGIPDGLITADGKTLAERRDQLLMRVRSLGSLHKQYYIDIAAALGYTVHVDEFTPAWSGIAGAGDPCGDQQVMFYWRVNVHYDFNNPFTNYDNLQYILNKLKPAHTVVIFRTFGPAFDSGFSQGFDAQPAKRLTIGGFSTGFDKGFDVHYGGGFSGQAFSDGFNKVYTHFGY